MMDEETQFVAHLPTSYGNVLLYLHTLTQLPVDQINLMCLLLIQACFGSIYRRLKSKFFRQWFGMIFGLFLIYSLYGRYLTFLLFIYVSFFYPIIFLFESPKLTFWLAMTSLFLTFGYNAWFDYLSWRLDITTSMMGIVVRVHTLSWDIVDGNCLNKSNIIFVDCNGNNLVNKLRNRELSFRMEHGCICQLSYFDYLSYMFFFIHSLCGSNLTINEYLYLTDRSLFKRNGWIDNSNDPSPSWKDIFYAIIEIFIVAALFLIGKIFLPICSYCGNIEFYNESFFFKKWYIIPLAVFLTKFKYHLGWKFLDLSCLTSCAAFSCVIYSNDKFVIKWDRARNINSFPTAIPNDTATVVRNWNMTVNDWLTNYVFSRAMPPKWLKSLMGDFGAKVLITRLTSAFFHGVYPGYWIFFFCSKFITDMINQLRKILPTYEDFNTNEKYSISAIFCFIFWALITIIPLDSMGTFFICLEIDKTIDLFNNIYWFPLVFTTMGLIIAQILSKTVGLKPSEQKKRRQRETSSNKQE